MNSKTEDLSVRTVYCSAPEKFVAGILFAVVCLLTMATTLHAAEYAVSSDYLPQRAAAEQTVQRTVQQIVQQCPESIAYSDIVECAIDQPDQMHVYTFSGSTDERVQLLLHNDSLPRPKVEVEIRQPSDGEVINFFSCKQSTSMKTLIIDNCQLPEDGSYQIWISITDGQDLDFSFTLRRLIDLPTNNTIAYGDSAAGEVDSEFDIDIYPFEGQAGERVRLILRNDTVTNPTLRMEVRQVSNGEVINFFSCRDIGSQDVELIDNCLLPETGSYQLWIYEDEFNNPAQYHFQFHSLSALPVNPPLSYATIVTGTVDTEFGIGIHPFEGEAGDRIQMISYNNTASNSSVIAEIRQVWNGELINAFTCRNISQRALLLIDNCLLPETGSYQLWIYEDEFRDSFQYNFKMDSLFDLPASGQLTLGDRVAGSIDAKFQIGIHPFEGQRNEQIQVTFNNNGGSLNASVRIVVRQTWDGAVVNSFTCSQMRSTNSFQIDNCLLPETGSYQVWVYGEDFHTLFEYDICVTTPGGDCVGTTPATPTSAPTVAPTATPTPTPTPSPEAPTPAGAKPLVLIYAVLDNNLGDIAGTWERLVNNAEAGVHDGINVMLLVDGPSTDDSYVYDLSADDDEFCPNLRNHTCNGRYVEGQNLWTWNEDSAHPETLLSFANKGIEIYPDRSAVILSLVGHGSGWSANYLPGQPSSWADQSIQRVGGMLWDDTPGDGGSSRSMSTRMLGYVLEKVAEELGQKIDLLYLDACSMGMAEVAYELRDSADYLLASANTAWSSFAYDDLLAATDIDDSAKAIGLDWLAAEANILEKNEYPFTLSLFDLARMNELATAVTSLGDALTTQLSEQQELIQLAYEQSERFESDYNGAIDDNGDTYIDLVSFTKRIEAQFSNEPGMLSAATSVQDAVSGVVVNRQLGRGNPWLFPGVEWSWAESSGLSIYVPLNQDEAKRALYTDENLTWASDTTWDEFLDAFWGGALQTASSNVKSSSANELPTCASTRDCLGLATQLEIDDEFEPAAQLVFIPIMQR